MRAAVEFADLAAMPQNQRTKENLTRSVSCSWAWPVGLAETVARVDDSERAVLLRGHFDQVSGRMRRAAKASAARPRRLRRRQHSGDGRVVLNVRDEGCRRVLKSHVVCPMQLPDILEAGRVEQHPEWIRLTTFARAVIHHRNMRL